MKKLLYFTTLTKELSQYHFIYMSNVFTLNDRKIITLITFFEIVSVLSQIYKRHYHTCLSIFDYPLIRTLFTGNLFDSFYFMQNILFHTKRMWIG